VDTLSYFGIAFDEGVNKEGETGSYGPYTQSLRKEVYQTMVKDLVKKGKAYPCFMSEEELEEIREKQKENKLDPGIYGEYARHRNLSYEEVETRIKNGEEFVVRFRSEGDPSKYFTVKDAVRGTISMPENIQDVVILKKIGLPTYHFAHLVDDHLMRVTHVVRGEEWMASVPIHVQLYEAMGWEIPMFCHNTVLMKIDEATGQKRKLSKRKDPELSLGYYKEMGYFPEAVREYLMTILNSDYEEWRIQNPNADYKEFAFSAAKMSSSGTLFDLNKLNDVSKDVLAKKSTEEIFSFMQGWAEEYHAEIAKLFAENKEILLKVFDIDRGGAKPRKDLVYAQQIFEFVKYFFDEYFTYQDEWPLEISKENRKEILARYLDGYNENDDNSAWFDKLKTITADLGYAVKPKDFKKNPDKFKAHIGHVSGIIRIAITGKANSPDLWTIQQIMGPSMVKTRIKKAMEQ